MSNPENPDRPKTPLFEVPNSDEIDVDRFGSYQELVKRHFQELMTAGDIWQPYLEALRGRFNDIDESITEGLEDEDVVIDRDGEFYQTIGREGAEQHIRGDGIFVVNMQESAIRPGNKFYILSQVDIEGTERPLTRVTVCGVTESGETFIEGNFTPEQASLIARLGDETDAFLRSK